MSGFKRSIWVALALFLALLAGTNVLRAQSDRGTITGTVTDPSGGVISGATVTATHTATGLKTSTVSGGGGNYAIPFLQVGTYRISATQAGFKAFVQEGVVLDVGQTAVVPISLQLGNVTQTVQVTGEASQLQTTTSTLSTAATSIEVESLPLFGQNEMRNPAFFMVLDSSTSGRGVANNGQGIFSNRNLTTTVAGSQSASTEFDVDGSRLVVESFLSSAYNMIGFPNDAVQEFSLTTISPPAEMGRSGGGVVSFNLKSGTNQFHGTGFEYFRNAAIDANNFFANSQAPGCDSSGQHVASDGTQACRTPLQQNEFGGTFGGPILKNKLFFFGWYDGFRYKQGSSASLVSTPTAAERQGDFSAFPDPIYDPATNADDGHGQTTRMQFGGNIIDPSRIDSVASAMIPYFPKPTNSNLFNNYLVTAVNGDTINEEGVKIDYELNGRNKFTGDYSYSGNSTAFGGANPYPPPLAESGPSVTNTPEFRLSYDLILAPNIVNHIQYGYNRFAQIGGLLDNIPGGWPAKLGFKGVGGDGAFPILNFNQDLPQSGGGGGNIPGGSTTNGTAINESLSWVTGKHTFKFGMEYERGGLNSINHYRDTGYLYLDAKNTGLPDASGVTTGSDFASFYLGQVFAGQTYVWNAQGYERSGYYAGYAQDDFKVSSKLTLNLGLRYDLYMPTVSASNQMSWMNPAVENPDAGDLKGAYQFSTSAKRSPLSAYTRAFAPRIGLAYQINNKTVIRANYSIIYGPGGYVRGNGNCCSDSFNLGYGNGIDGVSTSPTNGLQPYFTLANGWPASQFNNAPTTSPGLDIGGYAERLDPQDARPLYLENMAVQVQRELGFNTLLSVAWVGNTGVHLPSRVDPADEMPVQDLSYGPLLGDVIGTPAVQATAAVQNFPVDPATMNKTPFNGFEAAFGGGATLGQSLRIFPQYSGVKRFYESAGTSTYNSLQVKVDKRFSSGLNFLVSYTWSKTLTNAGSETTEFSGFDQDSFNARNQKAVSLNDYPSNLVISYGYDLPFGSGKKFLNRGGAIGKIVGGWKVSGIQQYQSGAPQEIYESNTLGNLEGNNDNGDGDSRPNYTGGAILSSAARSGHFDPNVDSMLNASVFSLSAPYTFGNGQQFYSNARRFPYLDEDIALSKKTYITERVSVELRADFQNVFNRAIFGLGTGGDMYGSVLFNNTVSNPVNPNFGFVTSQSNTPREIQFGLKISY